MTCYRHPDRQTYITCRRCGRPICGECMIPAAVGFQCPRCVKAGARATRQHQGPFGGQLSTNPRQTSIVLIAINALVWLVITVGGWVLPHLPLAQWLGLMPEGICAPPGEINSYYPGVGHDLCRATGGSWVPGVADGAWWQLVTSMFTHVSIIHIAMNCLTLWFIGPPLEMYLGRARFLVTYFVAGLGGSLGVYWLSSPTSLSYGASGALFGVMGCLLIVFWKQRADFKQLLLWIGLNLIITFAPLGGPGGASISWQAHVGGLVVGALLGCVWALLPSSARRGRTQWLLVAALALVIVIGLVGRTVMLV